MKVVYTIHDVVSFEEAPSNDRISTFIYQNADKILTHNEFSSKIFHQHYSKVFQKLEIVPHGNYVPFLENNKNKQDSRTRLNIPLEKHVLLFFGMIKEVKGLEILLLSLRKVIDYYPDLVLVIAGRIWKNDFSIYQKVINEHNLSEHCIIHDKFIPHDDVVHYYAASDLVVLPYKRIYQSGVLMMSMSYNKAVLVSDLPPLVDVVKDNYTGFVFPSQDVGLLSNKLISIFEDLDNIDKVRDRGFQYIKDKFSWERIGEKMKKVYKSIL